MASKSEIANKIERQLSAKDMVVLTVAEWNTVIDTLREPLNVCADGQYTVPASASHGPR